jgi:hypothetical protein
MKYKYLIIDWDGEITKTEQYTEAEMYMCFEGWYDIVRLEDLKIMNADGEFEDIEESKNK